MVCVCRSFISCLFENAMQIVFYRIFFKKNYLNLISLYFQIFLYVDIKNNFLKIKNIILIYF